MSRTATRTPATIMWVCWKARGTMVAEANTVKQPCLYVCIDSVTKWSTHPLLLKCLWGSVSFPYQQGMFTCTHY